MKESKLKILLADDSVDIDPIEKVLRTRGVDVTRANYPEEFHSLARKKHYDLVLLDADFCGNCYEVGQNPWLDKTEETLNYLREENPDTALILFTGHNYQEVRIFAEKMDGIITKPTRSSTELIERMQEAVYRKITNPQPKIPPASTLTLGVSYDPYAGKRTGD